MTEPQPAEPHPSTPPPTEGGDLDPEWQSQWYANLRHERDEARAEADRLRALAWELKVEYIDALRQGAGEEPLSTPCWHMYLSTYEYADQFLRRPDVVALIEPEGDR